tara:strand:+ start:1321 stop:1656 length:336 start_codon:yes stop_codon:yes gene_type:complete
MKWFRDLFKEEEIVEEPKVDWVNEVVYIPVVIKTVTGEVIQEYLVHHYTRKANETVIIDAEYIDYHVSIFSPHYSRTAVKSGKKYNHDNIIYIRLGEFTVLVPEITNTFTS